jgi:hypothetical protein
MKSWTSSLRTLLRLAIRDDAARFVVAEKRRDGVLVVRPTQDVRGIGGRLAARGILPAEAHPEEYEMLFEVERQDDPVWECRYVHIRARAGRRYAPLDAKLAIGWPVKNTDILVAVLRRALRELIEGARAERALAASGVRGLVDGLRRRP